MQYIGDLRNLAAEVFECGPEAIMLQYNQRQSGLFDDKTLGTMLMEWRSGPQHTGNAPPRLATLGVAQRRVNPQIVAAQPPDVQARILAECPRGLMARGSDSAAFMQMLLYLLDLPPHNTVLHLRAYLVLAELPNCSQVEGDLKTAMQPAADGRGSDAAGVALRRALCMPPEGQQLAQQRPGALLYVLEVLQSLMKPATGDPTGADMFRFEDESCRDARC